MIRSSISGLVYFMLFLSGAAALIYEVVWVRSLSLVFGGTHLAVTTVLSVFMGGLALGSLLIGKRVDTIKRPLKFYGLLEIGIALSAIAFIVLMKIYPPVYIFLVQGHEDSKFYITLIRVLFAFVTLIVPATLMGGTLPVLTRFVSGHSRDVGAHLSFLYGFNTLGAVAGTAAAGFFLLRYYSVSTALHTAIVINILIGLLCVMLADKVQAMSDPSEKAAPDPDVDRAGILPDTLPFRLVLAGIGVSGFCALGYEVLWTRILTLTIGTSVYGFTIMLVAFLSGIALGSETCGFFMKLMPWKKNSIEKQVAGFGIVQVIIGAAALFVTLHIRDLPVHSIFLKDFFLGRGLGVFDARQLANLTIAFSYMVVPAFFMGAAFPLAGNVHAAYKRKVGHAVGDVLAYNTAGAILGSAVSGYVMIYLFGLERSLQLLTIINAGFGLLVIISIRNMKILNWTAAAATIGLTVYLIVFPGVFRMWDARFFAIFQNNRPEIYDTREKVLDALENTDVLFYHEGIDSTISSISAKGGSRSLLVNGKVVASDSPGDKQCQLTLGHLPMLLHRDPKKALVVGLGTGMTLGAVSIHPGLKELTLAEIEPRVTGAARTFGIYNNHVLDDPKLRIIYNDGRNYLLTTKERFDVITADPIHPWTQGSGYLYTSEYFRLASERLLPGGIMCQWLPVYELSAEDLRSVVKTFSGNFRYTMAWVTHVDSVIIGSNSPILIDEEDLAVRIAHPAVSGDLKEVMMGTADDFLSYFVMGTEGMKAFSEGGVVNTDDNLYLEFSAPLSMGKNVMGKNVSSIVRHREDIIPYLMPAKDEKAREAQSGKWALNMEAAAVYDAAHAMFLGQDYQGPEFRYLLSMLESRYPSYAPGRFLNDLYIREMSRTPVLLMKTALTFMDDSGAKVVKEISAVRAGVSEERAAVMFVDNEARTIYGQIYLSGTGLDERTAGFASEVISDINNAYSIEARAALEQGREFPLPGPAMQKIRNIIEVKVREKEADFISLGSTSQ